VLSALRKAGKTGLTERVWILAKRAERISWMTNHISPWFLPVQAYTVMLQCYAAEARKGLGRGRTIWSPTNEDQQHDWQPLSKQHVRGWARFILSQKSITSDTPRRSAARFMGMQLYSSMKNGAREVFDSFVRLKTVHEGSSLSIPRPDARFFNAALDIFAYQKGRGTRVSRSRWSKKLLIAQMRYARGGVVSRKLDSMIQTITQEMVQYGFSVPIGLRPMLIGRMPSRDMFQGERWTLDRRPFAFPRVRHTFRPHGVPTFKTRGLAVRHPRDRRHYRRYKRTSSETGESKVTMYNV